jgi:hypothetical protein
VRHTLDLPAGYHLKRDPDILTLCRLDGSIVTAFSSGGVNLNEVRKAAELDHHRRAIHDREPPLPDAVTDQPCSQARFFGHFEMLCNGEPVDLGRNGKALAIFKYLLAHRDRRVSRDHLMGWMWPYGIYEPMLYTMASCGADQILCVRTGGHDSWSWQRLRRRSQASAFRAGRHRPPSRAHRDRHHRRRLRIRRPRTRDRRRVRVAASWRHLYRLLVRLLVRQTHPAPRPQA